MKQTLHKKHVQMRHHPHSMNTSSSKLKKPLYNKQLKTINYLESTIIKDDVLNCQQFACQQLKEQSLLHVDHLNMEPDFILRVTPRLKSVGDSSQSNKIVTLGVQNVDIPRKNKALSVERTHSKTQKSPQKSLPSTHYPTKNRFSMPNSAILGKQALSLTQYIVTGPSWHMSSIQNPRKLERSKYIRVLKQMKYRNMNINVNRDMNMKNCQKLYGRDDEDVRAKNEVRNILDKREEIESFYCRKNGDLEKLFLSSQRVKKSKEKQGRRGHSLRVSQNQIKSFDSSRKNKPIFI